MAQEVTEAAKHARPKPLTFFDFLLQPKFIVMLLIGAAVLLLLKTKKMKKSIKTGLLLLSTFLFGFAGNIPADFFHSFAMHPSPMCAASKPLLFGFHIPFIVTLAVIFFLTLVGPKLFCGYICPLGAVQELISMLAAKLKITRKKFSFVPAHTVRLLIFLLFIFISVTAVLYETYEGQVFPKSLYDYINPFHGLEFSANASLIGYLIHYLPFILVVILAFKYYRPYCHFVCPIGIFAHVLEQVALFKISLKRKSCTDCGVCEKKSPCTAVPEILKESLLRPDCYACNECIEVCPEKALEVGVKRTTLK